MDDRDKLDQIHETVLLLKVAVYGPDGHGGLVSDVRSLVSLRDKGIGVLAAIALVASVLILGIKSWIIALFPGVK